MKNRTVKRVLALAVTAALAGSMVACGGYRLQNVFLMVIRSVSF